MFLVDVAAGLRFIRFIIDELRHFQGASIENDPAIAYYGSVLVSNLR